MQQEENMSETRGKEILTVPNLLSMLRLCMIPLFVWLYCAKEAFGATALVLVLSGITDIVDGFIARRFHMVSDFGKILDPIADKLTQAAMLLCLFFRFPKMLILFFFLAAKEIFAGIMGLLIMKKTGKVHSSDWHGKITTALLYAMMILHVIFPNINMAVSNMLFAACGGMMLLSCALYAMRNFRLLKAEET